MRKKISRRSFIGSAAAFGAAAVCGLPPPDRIPAHPPRMMTDSGVPEMAVVRGDNPYEMTRKAIQLLGGMQNFVSSRATVGLLINSDWKNPGTYTNPDIALAVLRMCLEAGAKKVTSIENAPSSYWTRSALASTFTDELSALENSGKRWVRVEIPKGIKLKSAEINAHFLECDVLIDIPVTKDHRGTRFTGTLKNVMGACPYSTNRFFHYGSGASGGYDDIDHLSQCIVDLNRVREPDLCVVDSTMGLRTNGPGGPGAMIRPGKVSAGRDRVALDAHSAGLLGLQAQNIMMIRKAYEAGMGKIEQNRMKIEETTL